MSQNIWEKYPEIWKTQSAFFTWMRGGVRRSLWNKHPVKLEFIKNNRKKIPNPNPRGHLTHVWGADCALCNGTFVIKNIEVDHKQGNSSLNCVADIQGFVERIVLITEDDLQLVCKDCHKAKSLAEKQGISFEDALIEKKIIAIMKAKGDKSWLNAKGISPKSSAAKRREQIKNQMRIEMIGGNNGET